MTTTTVKEGDNGPTSRSFMTVIQIKIVAKISR
jgi:hypothetical protein